MKKEIKIQIPDDLSKAEEIIAIAKGLARKALSDNPRTPKSKRIGNEVSVLETEFTIKVERVSKEKPIELCKCSLCGTEYQSSLAKSAYTNYGGPIRQLFYCSTACVDIVVSAFPERVWNTKAAGKIARLF